MALSFAMGATMMLAWLPPMVWSLNARQQPSVIAIDPVRYCRWFTQESYFGERVLIDPMHADIYFRGDFIRKSRVVAEMPDLSFGGLTSLNIASLPPWTTGHGIVGRAEDQWPEIAYWREERYGWPFLCFKQLWLLDRSTGKFVLRGGLNLKLHKNSLCDATGGEIGLPFIPIWIGLISNVLIYLITVWVASILFVSVRKKVLQCCGKCVHCGYVMIGLTGRCPECGHDLPRKYCKHS
jgi:hypothetical protein